MKTRRWLARALEEAAKCEMNAKFVWARQHRPKRAMSVEPKLEAIG